MQLSEYLHDPTEYGLHINTHVSLWLHSRNYDNKPLLVQAFGFVIVTEKIHEEFDAFVASMPLLTQGCYLQCGPLLQYWNMHMRHTPASVANLFTNEYFYLYYSDVDNLCEWVCSDAILFCTYMRSAWPAPRMRWWMYLNPVLPF